MKRPDDPKGSLSARFSHRVLMKLFKQPDKTDFLKQCAHFDESHQIWAAKLTARKPGEDLRLIKNNLRNVCFVIIMKEPFAVVQRSLSIRNEHREPVRRAAQILKTSDYYRELLNFAVETDAPVLLLSYELAMKSRAETLREVARFLGVQNVNVERGLRILNRSWDKYFKVAANFVERRSRPAAVSEPAESVALDSRVSIIADPPAPSRV